MKHCKGMLAILFAAMAVLFSPGMAYATNGEGWYGGDLGISGSCVLASTNTVNIYWYSCVDYDSAYGQVAARAHPSSLASGYANVCEYSYNTTNGVPYASTCGALLHSPARVNFSTAQSFVQGVIYCPIDANPFHAMGGDNRGQQASSYATYTASLSKLCT